MLKKIKILALLPSAIAADREKVNVYEVSRITKAYETFCYLKAISESGKLQPISGESWHRFVCRCAAYCNISKNSMYNRLPKLIEQGLMKRDKHNCLTLASWDHVMGQFNITKKNFYEINCIPGAPRLEYVLKALAIKENKSQQQHRFKNKLKNNRVRQMLKDELGEDLVKGDFKKLRQTIVQHQIATFSKRSDIYFDFFHSLRADDNLSENGINNLFGYSARKSAGYIKGVLEKLKLITVEKRSFLSALCTRRPHNVFYDASDPTDHELIPMTLPWDEKRKLRNWIMPDAITINLS